MSSLPLLYAAEAKRIYIFYFWREEWRSQMREIFLLRQRYELIDFLQY